MRRIFLFFSFTFFVSQVFAQALTLDECYSLARLNYPLIQQHDLINAVRDYSIENVHTGRYPQVSLNAQATYQSAVTRIPIDNPQFRVQPLAKDQYKVYADFSQSVYDGGLIRKSSELQHAAATLENQKTEVDLYKLKDRVNQIFFGILLLEEQQTQTHIIRKDLESSLNKIRASVEAGVSLKMQADQLLAEMLKTDQRIIELAAIREAYIKSLSLLTGKDLGPDSKFKAPENTITFSTDISRPEIKMFNDQRTLIGSQLALNLTKTQPKAALFLQTGYGRPGLNMLVNEFQTYYLGGVRLNWNLSGLWNIQRDRKISDLNLRMVDVQQQIFELNTRITANQFLSEINKLDALIRLDEEIVSLRSRIKQAAQAQLDNGVISANDYLRELNAEDQANQNLLLHKIQRTLAQYNYASTNGN
jgi:outer membrane protein TolC